MNFFFCCFFRIDMSSTTTQIKRPKSNFWWLGYSCNKGVTSEPHIYINPIELILGMEKKLFRVLLGAPSIFAGAPRTWGENPVIPLVIFFKKTLDSLSPASLSLSLSLRCSFFFFFLTQPLILLLPQSHFRIVLETSWTCLSRATFFFFLVWFFFFFLSHEPWTTSHFRIAFDSCCREEEPRTTVHLRGIIVSVDRRGKHHFPLFPPLMSEYGSLEEVTDQVIRNLLRRSLRIKWSVTYLDVVYGSSDP